MWLNGRKANGILMFTKKVSNVSFKSSCETVKLNAIRAHLFIRHMELTQSVIKGWTQIGQHSHQEHG